MNRDRAPRTGEVFKEIHRFWQIPIFGATGWIVYGGNTLFVLVSLVTGTTEAHWVLYVLFPLAPLALLYVPVVRVRLDDDGVHTAKGFRYHTTPYAAIVSFDFQQYGYDDRIRALFGSPRTGRMTFLAKHAVTVRLTSGGSVQFPVRNWAEAKRLLDYRLDASSADSRPRPD